jgi:hypothetical protein
MQLFFIEPEFVRAEDSTASVDGEIFDFVFL